MRNKAITTLAVAMAGIAMSLQCEAKSGDKTSAQTSAQIQPIDPNATRETKELLGKLRLLQGKGILFGHQNDNITGRDFSDAKQELLRSDTKTATGEYPAVFGMDFNSGFTRVLQAAINAAKAGGIVTISYHMSNPYGDEKSAYVVDTSRHEVQKILPGGELHKLFVSKLDSIADFAARAVVNGKRIPIIFRPWHEHTGDWFWWGASSCTEEQFKALWRFTIEYLRDVKKVHNLLYAFSPSQPINYGSYDYRNPGADYFDIAGFDCYKPDGFREAIVQNAEMTVAWAIAHNKVPAITEFGSKKGTATAKNPNWFTEEFLYPIKASELARQVTYALTWGNSSNNWWVPLRGDIYYDDFIRMYKDPYMMFIEKWKSLAPPAL